MEITRNLAILVQINVLKNKKVNFHCKNGTKKHRKEDDFYFI